MRTPKRDNGKGLPKKRRESKRVDPLLSTYHWRTVVRRHHVNAGKPCARCGGPIDYVSPRFFEGTRKVNPLTLAVGHIVGRHEAKRLGWTDAQINALSNTQAEHAQCSDRSGAVYLNSLKGKGKGMLRVVIDETAQKAHESIDKSREW
jgi:hypothetical protein